MHPRRIIITIAAIIAALSINSRNISGNWNGVLKVTPQLQLKIAIHLTEDNDGKATATLDSPDQGAYGIPCDINFLSNDSICFSIPKLNASYSGRSENGKLIGKFRQGFITANLDLSPGEITVNRPQTPKPPFPYTTEEIKFKNGNDSTILAGTLTLPSGATTNTPIAVMVTGSGLQNRDEELFGHKPFAVIADYLARNGIGTLRYDDRGFGESTGDASTATIADFAGDAKAAVEFLRNSSFNNIGILGHSEGAMIAFMLAGKELPKAKKNEVIVYPGRPDFVVALGAPALRGDSILMDQSALQLRRTGIPEKVIEDYSTALLGMYEHFDNTDHDKTYATIDTLCSGWPVNPIYTQLKTNLQLIAKSSSPYLEYFVKYSPAKVISATKCPMFILYGEKDIQVRPELNMPIMKSLAPEAEIKLYPGLNHLFQHAATGDVSEYSSIEETISPEVLQDISSFIKSVIN